MASRDEIEGWLARAAMGDRRAFGALYEATAAKLFGICLRVLGDRAAAEDALQEAYVKIWNGAGRYRSNGLSPITWMAAVARNHAIDRLRARRRAARRGAEAGGRDGAQAAEAVHDAAPGPERLAEIRGEAARVAACMAELEPRRAEAVRRAYLMGESHAELAARLEVPVNTLKTWLRRSLIALRGCLAR